MNAEALIANDFHLRGADTETSREGRISLDTPVRIGKLTIPAHAEAHLLNRPDGTGLLEGAARLSASIDRFNLGTEVHYRKDLVSSGPAPPQELTIGLLGSGRIGAVRLRGSAEFDVRPSSSFRSAELDAYWSATEHTDWEGDLAYERTDHRVRASLTHILRFDSFALSLTGEAASNGDVAFGFNLNFSLDPRHGFTLSRRPLAEGGMIHATVFRDLNDNGVHDPGEPLEKGALITTGTRQARAKRPTATDRSPSAGSRPTCRCRSE